MSAPIRVKQEDTWIPIILIDDTDFKSEETGKLVGDFTVKYCASDQSSFSPLTLYDTGSNKNWEEVGLGVYRIMFTSTEMDELGLFIAHVDVAGALPYFILLEVTERTTEEDSDNIASVLDDTGTDGVKLAATAIDEIWDELTSGHDDTGSFGELFLDNIDAAISSRSSHTAAAVATAVWDELIATGRVTDSYGEWIQTMLDAAVSTRSSHDADAVWSVSTRALTDKAGFTISGTLTTLDALLTQMETTHGAGSWETATGFSTHDADAVWAVATRALTDKAGFTISGTIQTLDALKTDFEATHGAGSWETATGFSTHDAAAVWSYVSRSLTDKAGFTISGTTQTLDALKTLLDTDHGPGSWETATGFSTHSAAEVATAVWDELIATGRVTGSYGEWIQTILDAAISTRASSAELSALETHGDGAWATATGFSTHSEADVADAVWDELISGHTDTGSFGEFVQSITGFSTHTAADVWAVATRTITGGYLEWIRERFLQRHSDDQDAAGHMTEGRERWYDSEANLDADDWSEVDPSYVTGCIAEYFVKVTWSAATQAGHFVNQKRTKVWEA